MISNVLITIYWVLLVQGLLMMMELICYMVDHLNWYLIVSIRMKDFLGKVLEVQLFTVKIVSPIPPSSENKDVVENYKTMILIKDSLAPLTPLVNR